MASIARLGLIRCIFEFTAGTVLCALWQRWRDLPAAPSRCRLAVLAVLAASAALYHGVEKPAQRWINQHLPERLHRPGQATARS
jgi:peptidoglycan/LPS O-acetylase OafA/YrhL